jgi:hypothetical protein
MGLLDSFMNPQTMGLLGLAQGLGQAAMPSRLPVPMGAAASMGTQGLLGGIGQGMQNAMMMEKFKMLQGLMGGPQSSGIDPNSVTPALQTGADTPSQGTVGAMFSGGTAPAGPGPTKYAENFLTQPPQEPVIPTLGRTPSQLFHQGMVMSFLGIPGGGDLMSLSAKYDPNVPTDATRMAVQGGQDPRTVNAAEIKKQTYIAPTRLGEGAYFDPTLGVQGLPSAAPPGFINTRDQSGNWQTNPVTNGLDAAAISKGALEAAQEGNKIMTITDGSGRQVPVWAGNVAGRPPVTGGQGSSQFTQMPPAAPQSPPIQSPPVQAPAPSSGNPWSSVPQFQLPGGVGQDTYHKGLAEGAATKMGELSTKYGTQADSANQQIALYNDALENLKTASTGSGAMKLTEFQNLLQSRFGVDPQGTLFKAVNAGDPAATVELNKELVNAALKNAKAIYGPRMTQKEVELQIQQASPNPDQPIKALTYLINLGKQQSQYQIQQAEDLSKYRAQGGDPYAFEGWYAKNFPMAQSVGHAAMSPTQQPTTAPAPSHGPAGLPSQSAIAAEMARRGLK